MDSPKERLLRILVEKRKKELRKRLRQRMRKEGAKKIIPFRRKSKDES